MPGDSTPVACPSTAPGSSFDLSDGSVTSGKLADGAVTSTKIATDAVTAAAIAADAIGSDEIAADAVTTSAILDGTVTTADISQAVWSGVHQAGTLAARPIASPANAGYLYFATDINGGTLYRSDGASWVKLAAGAAEAAIPDGSIDTAKLADNAVTSAKIANGTIASADLSSTSGSEAVNTANIRDNAVATAKIAALAVDATKLAAGAVTNAKLGTDAVTTDKITDFTIVAADIATGAITSAKILDATITNADIANGTIQTGDLASGAAGENLYRLVQSRSGKLDRDAAASTYVLPAGGTVGNGVLMEDGVDLERDAGVFYLSSADHALSGRTTQLRLRATLLANGTAPGVTVKVGLYPVTANGGGNDKNNVTIGSVVSEVTFSSIGANSRNVQTSADFAFPSSGFYVIGVNTNGALNNNALVDMSADLHVRNI